MHNQHPPRQPHPHGEGNESSPINHAAEVRARAAAPEVYTPPAGFSADPAAWLVELHAGNFTPEQIAYLRSGALGQYEAALASHPDPLGEQIAGAWRAWLVANPAPPAGNPFNP